MRKSKAHLHIARPYWIGPARPWIGPARPWVGPDWPWVGPERPLVGPERPWVGPERPWMDSASDRSSEVLDKTSAGRTEFFPIL